MNIIEALKLCKEKQVHVRPVSWRTMNQDCWVEFRRHVFVEVGYLQEICHALRLQHPDEFLGEWELER